MKHLKEALVHKHMDQVKIPKLKIGDVVEYRDGKYGVVVNTEAYRRKQISFLVLDDQSSDGSYFAYEEWDEQTWKSNVDRQNDVINVYVVPDMKEFRLNAPKIHSLEDMAKSYEDYVKRVVDKVRPLKINN